MTATLTAAIPVDPDLWVKFTPATIINTTPPAVWFQLTTAAAAGASIASATFPAGPGGTHTITCTAQAGVGYPIKAGLVLTALDAAGATVATVTGADLTLTLAEQPVTLTIGPLPATAVAVRVLLQLRETVTAATRQMGLITVTRSSTATVAEVVAVGLTQQLRREAVDVLDIAAPMITYSTPGLLSGSLTYLAATAGEVFGLARLYASASAATTLGTGAGVALDGLKHVAVGTLRFGVERAGSGRPPWWTLTADIREMP